MVHTYYVTIDACGQALNNDKIKSFLFPHTSLPSIKFISLCEERDPHEVRVFPHP